MSMVRLRIGTATYPRRKFVLFTHDMLFDDPSGASDLRSALRARVGQEDGAPRPPLAFANALLAHLDQNRWLHRALLGERTALVVQKHFRRLLLELIAEDLTPLVPDGRRRDLAVRFVAGGLYELLLWWVDALVPEALATVATAMQEFTRPVIDTANAPDADLGGDAQRA
jgi:hypothetical protein